MRGDGTPKGAPCNRPRLISRIAEKQRHTATPLSVPPRRLLRPWDLTYRHRREQARHPGRLPHPSPAPSQPFKAEPRSGLGRLPRAPRVCVCETQPRAPHPTGLGYPAPAKLSLCPTSVTPLEAPLTGQDRECIPLYRNDVNIEIWWNRKLFSGFDPATDPFRKSLARMRWIRGPSPRRRAFGPAGGSSPRITHYRVPRRQPWRRASKEWATNAREAILRDAAQARGSSG
jgi:hypothetical protein